MKKKVICYICADLNDPFSIRKLAKFNTCAAERGFSVVAIWPGFSWYMPGSEWKMDFFKIFSRDTFCAVVLDGEFGFNKEILARQSAIMKEYGIPLVILDGEVSGAINVVFEDKKVAEELLDHLVTVHGARDILFVGDEGNIGRNDKYFRIYKKFLKKADIPYDESKVALCNSIVGTGIENIYRVLGEHKPDAVFCVSSMMGIATVSVASALGFSIPGDFVVVGMNGVNNRRAGIPDLTAGTRNLSQMGTKALQLIEKKLADPEKEVSGTYHLPMNLHLSESCGCGRMNNLNIDEFVRGMVMEKNLAVAQERRQNLFFNMILDAKELSDMKEAFRDILPDNSFFCIRDSFAENASGAKNLPSTKDNFTVFVSNNPGQEGIDFNQSYLFELAEQQSKNAAPLILYPAYVQRENFGFVVSDSPQFTNMQMMMGRFLLALCRTLSFFSRNLEIEKNNEKLKIMNEDLRNAQIRDPMTGLFNNSGLIYELEKVKKKCIENGERLNYVCLDLDHLSNINDIYGHNEGDCAIIDVAEIIKESVLRDDICAHLGADEFMIFLRAYESDGERSVDSFLRYLHANIDAYNRSTDKEYTLNVNVSTGVVVLYEDTDMSQVIDDALSDKRLLKNNRRGTYIAGAEELNADELRMEDMIREVIDENLFHYAYQPIVKASDGSIFGYEVLMRTDTKEPISPLTIIKYATIKQRLYDIEQATFYNIFKDITEKKDQLEGKKIFMNSIPGYQIDQADYAKLKKKYPHVFKNLFIEVTEQSEQNDEEIRVLTERSNEDGFSIAIDDYGCGYANTSSLLRYTPNCVKIDRLLISNIHSDPRKQHFVKNIIEFAHDNNFYALAEGVETADELKAVIALGIDLIQGFYLAKPNLEIAKSIPEHLIKEIEAFNLRADDNHFSKLYVVSKEREMMLTRIALELYTEILLSGQEVTLIGNNEYPAAVKIRVKENTNTTLTIRNIILENNPEDVGIELGENATLTLIIEGENFIYSNGIKVPENSLLKIQGDGNLHIRTKCQGAFGIGNDLLHPFGNVIMDISGELDIDVNGERAVGIGGNLPGENVKLQLRGGNNVIKSQSTAFVGIGAFSGNVIADISETHFAIDYNCVSGVGIGTPSGISNVRVSHALLEIKGGGKSITGIGSASKGDNQLEILSAQVILNMNSPRVIMLGCPFGRCRVYIEHSKVELYGSGGRVLGIGCADMGGELILRRVGLIIQIHSQSALPLGVKPENQDFGKAVPEIEVINEGGDPELTEDPELISYTGPPPGVEGFGPPPGMMGVGGPPPGMMGVGGPPPGMPGAGGPPPQNIN